jgi:hypothetical protein
MTRTCYEKFQHIHAKQREMRIRIKMKRRSQDPLLHALKSEQADSLFSNRIRIVNKSTATDKLSPFILSE